MQLALPPLLLAAVGFAMPAAAQCRDANPRYPLVHVHWPFLFPVVRGHRDHFDPPRTAAGGRRGIRGARLRRGHGGRGLGAFVGELAVDFFLFVQLLNEGVEVLGGLRRGKQAARHQAIRIGAGLPDGA